MTSPIQTLQFVSAPDPAATLRYDFNIKTAALHCHPLNAGGFTLGTPQFDGQPEAVGVDYGYRQIRLVQRIEGTKADALARQSLLAKELLRPYNWLKLQFNPLIKPVYFKTYRGDLGDLDLENSETASVWDISVPLVAEGFAYGERVTISTSQIVQSPADLAGPVRTAMRVVLPTIKGDAPTALRVGVTPATGQTVNVDWEWLFACVAGTASMQDPVLNIGTADGFTVFTGAAPVTTPDATFFSGDYRTFSATTTEIQMQNPTFGVTARGRYKVLVRGEFTTGITYLLTVAVNTNTSTTTAFTPASPGTFQGWVDLGDVLFPGGIPVPDDLSVTIPTQILRLFVKTASGAGTAKLDAIKVIPISGPTVLATTLLRAKGSGSTILSGDTTGIIDGDSELFWGTFAGVVSPLIARLAGGFLYADPAAAQNVLELMAISRGTNVSGATSTSRDAQAAVDVSYYPRYLHVGDGT